MTVTFSSVFGLCYTPLLSTIISAVMCLTADPGKPFTLSASRRVQIGDQFSANISCEGLEDDLDMTGSYRFWPDEKNFKITWTILDSNDRILSDGSVVNDHCAITVFYRPRSVGNYRLFVGISILSAVNARVLSSTSGTSEFKVVSRNEDTPGSPLVPLFSCFIALLSFTSIITSYWFHVQSRPSVESANFDFRPTNQLLSGETEGSAWLARSRTAANQMRRLSKDFVRLCRGRDFRTAAAVEHEMRYVVNGEYIIDSLSGSYQLPSSLPGSYQLSDSLFVSSTQQNKNELIPCDVPLLNSSNRFSVGNEKLIVDLSSSTSRNVSSGSVFNV